jgi:hypothetical protein
MTDFSTSARPHRPTRDEAIPTSPGALWFGVLAGPLTWLWTELIGYAMVRWSCAEHTRLVLHIVVLAALIIVVVAGLTAWRRWRAAGSEWRDEMGGPVGRTRFMAMGGMALSTIFALLILAQGFTTVVILPCD